MAANRNNKNSNSDNDEKRKYKTDENAGVLDPRHIEPAHNNLRDAISSRELTQKAFAIAFMGTTDSTVERWLKGYGEFKPGYRLTNGELVRASHVLDCSILYLLDLTDESEPPRDAQEAQRLLSGFESRRKALREGYSISKDPSKVATAFLASGRTLNGSAQEEEDTLEEMPLSGIKGENLQRVVQVDVWQLNHGAGNSFSLETKRLFRMHSGEFVPSYDRWLIDSIGATGEYAPLTSQTLEWLESYPRECQKRLQDSLKSIPGDYRSLVGVCKVMIDNIAKSKSEEAIERMCADIVTLYQSWEDIAQEEAARSQQ